MRKHANKSIVRPWLAAHCSFKEQAVVLSALRGCDGIPKEDVSKQLTRKMRSIMFYPASVRVMNNEASKYMKATLTPEMVTQFVEHLDHYPMHWVMHFTHAVEIIGYRHPVPSIRDFWHGLYRRIMREGLHVNPETIEQLNTRLGDEDDWAPLAEDLVTVEPGGRT